MPFSAHYLHQKFWEPSASVAIAGGPTEAASFGSHCAETGGINRLTAALDVRRLHHPGGGNVSEGTSESGLFFNHAAKAIVHDPAVVAAAGITLDPSGPSSSRPHFEYSYGHYPTGAGFAAAGGTALNGHRNFHGIGGLRFSKANNHNGTYNVAGGHPSNGSSQPDILSTDSKGHGPAFQRPGRRATSPSGGINGNRRRTNGAPSPSRSYDGTPFGSYHHPRLSSSHFGILSLAGGNVTDSHTPDGRTTVAGGVLGLTAPGCHAPAGPNAGHHRGNSSGSAGAASNPELYHHSYSRNFGGNPTRRQGPGGLSERLGPTINSRLPLHDPGIRTGPPLPSSLAPALSAISSRSRYLRSLPLRGCDRRIPPDPIPELWEPEAEFLLSAETGSLQLAIYNAVQLPAETLRILLELVYKGAQRLQPAEKARWMMTMSAAAFDMFSAPSSDRVQELRRVMTLVVQDTLRNTRREAMTSKLLRGCLKTMYSFFLVGSNIPGVSHAEVCEMVREITGMVLASPKASSTVTRLCILAMANQAADNRMRRRGGAEDIYYAPRVYRRDGKSARAMDPEARIKKRYFSLDPQLESCIVAFLDSHTEEESQKKRRREFENTVRDLVFHILLVRCQRYGSSFTGFSLDDSDCDMGVDIDAFIATSESEKVPAHLLGGQRHMTWGQLDEQKTAQGSGNRIAADIARYLFEGLRDHPDIRSGYLGRELRDNARKPLTRIYECRPPDSHDPRIKFQPLSVDIAFSRGLPGVRNSCVLRHYNELDPRVRPLVLLVKYWSKTRAVNGAFMGYLSSYAHTLTVIDFLQRIEPPVLPNIQMPKFKRPGPPPVTNERIHPEQEDPRKLTRVATGSFADEYLAEDAVWFNNRDEGLPVCELPWASWRSENKLTIAQLLVEYFRWMALECPWSDCVISPRVAPYKLYKTELFIANNEFNFPPAEVLGLPVVSKSGRQKRNKQERERARKAHALASANPPQTPPTVPAAAAGTTVTPPDQGIGIHRANDPNSLGVERVGDASAAVPRQSRHSVASNWSQQPDEQLTEISSSDPDPEACSSPSNHKNSAGSSLSDDLSGSRARGTGSAVGDRCGFDTVNLSPESGSSDGGGNGIVSPTIDAQDICEAMETPEGREILEMFGFSVQVLAEQLKRTETLKARHATEAAAIAQRRQRPPSGHSGNDTDVEPNEEEYKTVAVSGQTVGNANRTGDLDEDDIDLNWESAFHWMYLHDGHTYRSFVQEKPKNGQSNFHKICIEDPCENERILQPFKNYANEQLVTEYLRAHMLFQAGRSLNDVFRELVPRNYNPQVNDHIDWAHFRCLRWFKEQYGAGCVTTDEDVIVKVRMNILFFLLSDLEAKGIFSQPTLESAAPHFINPKGSIGQVDVNDSTGVAGQRKEDNPVPQRHVADYIFPRDPEEPLDEYWLRKPDLVKAIADSMADCESRFAREKLVLGLDAEEEYKREKMELDGSRYAVRTVHASASNL